MADFPKSNSEVPFLSELQFCSKVEVNNSSESEASPALPKKVVLIHRPDLAAILDSQDQSDISPGRFASSRSRYRHISVNLSFKKRKELGKVTQPVG